MFTGILLIGCVIIVLIDMLNNVNNIGKPRGPRTSVDACRVMLAQLFVLLMCLITAIALI